MGIAHAGTGTPFLNFWRALNDQCRLTGSKEPTNGTAQRAWRAAILSVAGDARRAERG